MELRDGNTIARLAVGERKAARLAAGAAAASQGRRWQTGATGGEEARQAAGRGDDVDGSRVSIVISMGGNR